MSSETILARREARRRKILENSENRLNRITGKSTIKLDSDFVFVKENGLTNDDDVPKKPSSYKVASNENCLYFNSNTVQSDLPPPKVSSESSNANISSPPSIQLSENPSPPPSTITTIQYKSIVFILCAILFRIIIEFDAHHFCACSLVFAFALAELGVVVVQGLPPYDSSQFLASLLLLSGISHRKIKAFIMFSTLSSSFVKDFSLFTFAFVIMHVIVTWCQSI